MASLNNFKNVKTVVNNYTYSPTADEVFSFNKNVSEAYPQGKQYIFTKKFKSSEINSLSLKVKRSLNGMQGVKPYEVLSAFELNKLFFLVDKISIYVLDSSKCLNNKYNSFGISMLSCGK